MSSVCSCPDCNNPAKFSCSSCQSVSYCSKNCQKTAWPSHKDECKKLSLKRKRNVDSLSVKEIKYLLQYKATRIHKSKGNVILSKCESTSERSDLLKLVSQYITETDDALHELIVSALEEGEKQALKKQEKLLALNRKNTPTGMTGKKNFNFSNNMPTPTPDQLLQQAKMMRSNPSMIRNANAMFKNMSDKEIIEYANQIEQAAKNPDMLKQMSKFSNLSQDDRENFAYIQDVFTKKTELSYEVIDKIIDIVKSNPTFLINLLDFYNDSDSKAKEGGPSSGTIDTIKSYLKYIVEIDSYYLKLIFHFFFYLYNCYNKLNEYTFNSGKYIVMFLAFIFLYYASIFGFYIIKKFIFAILMIKNMIFSSNQLSSSSSSVNNNNIIDENVNANSFDL